MAKGYQHASASVGLSIALATLPGVGEASLLRAVGCILGIFIQPDLDQGLSYFGGRMIRERSQVLWFIWKWYWKPYAILIPHRSPLSHFPFIGTLIRMVWAELPYLFYLSVTSGSVLLGFKLWLLQLISSEIFWGLVYSDVLHWAMDFYDPDTS